MPPKKKKQADEKKEQEAQGPEKSSRPKAKPNKKLKKKESQEVAKRELSKDKGKQSVEPEKTGKHQSDGLKEGKGSHKEEEEQKTPKKRKQTLLIEPEETPFLTKKRKKSSVYDSEKRELQGSPWQKGKLAEHERPAEVGKKAEVTRVQVEPEERFVSRISWRDREAVSAGESSRASSEAASARGRREARRGDSRRSTLYDRPYRPSKEDKKMLQLSKKAAKVTPGRPPMYFWKVAFWVLLCFFIAAIVVYLVCLYGFEIIELP